jgi:hypothetical protein
MKKYSLVVLAAVGLIETVIRKAREDEELARLISIAVLRIIPLKYHPTAKEIIKLVLNYESKDHTHSVNEEDRRLGRDSRGREQGSSRLN